MTLIEVIIAMVILSGVVLGMGSYVTKFARGGAEASIRSTASDLVSDRLEQIKACGKYSTLEATYAGTESSLAGFPGYSRSTVIQRVNTPAVDYKVITVTVSNVALSSPIKKTTMISSF